MKTKKELDALKKEIEDLSEEVRELNDAELDAVTGGKAYIFTSGYGRSMPGYFFKALKGGVPSNISQALQGMAAGVTLTSSSGKPGEEDPTFRVRGGSSLNGSNEPLIVIDGLAMDNIGMFFDHFGPKK